MRSFSLFTLILVLSTAAYSQRAECRTASEKSEMESVGANMIVVSDGIKKVREIHGIITDSTSSPLVRAIIDVYSVKGMSKHGSGDQYVKDQSPLASYKVDSDGRFCLKGLKDGEYVLRIGTDRFAFMHTYIKVRKTKSGSKRPIEIMLELGT